MSETWEETKARLKAKGINLQSDIVVVDTPKPPRPRYDEPAAESEIPLWEIRKITLPIDQNFPQGKVVVYGVTRAEADWWLEFKPEFKTKTFYDDTTNTKTLVMFEKFLIGGTPKERNIYSNPARFCTEDVPEFTKTPRRV